jgi:hypothetical protein
LFDRDLKPKAPLADHFGPVPAKPDVDVAPLWLDATLGAAILAIIPLMMGVGGYDLAWFAAYTAAAATFLSFVAWARQRRQARFDAESFVVATLMRMLPVFLVGGIFLIVGSLIF